MESCVQFGCEEGGTCPLPPFYPCIDGLNVRIIPSPPTFHNKIAPMHHDDQGRNFVAEIGVGNLEIRACLAFCDLGLNSTPR